MSASCEKQMHKTNSIFDISKMIFCIMVVCIHTNVLPGILFPWIRIAVPMYFLMSSYFLFQKLHKADCCVHKAILQQFISRNLTFYLFWFVILLPVTLHYDHWFTGKTVLQGLALLLNTFFFFELFRAGWFLMALMLGVLIVYLSLRLLSNRMLLIFTGIIYVLLCLRTAYSELLYQHASIVMTAFETYDAVFSRGYLSFPCSLFWIACGKWFAEHSFSWDRKLPQFCH